MKKILIKSRIFLIFITLVMILSATHIFVPNNQNVKADGGGGGSQEGVGLDFDFMHEITENLSNVIYYSYPDPDDLPKGRFFGSVGEHDAANYLNNTFNNILGIPAELDRIEKYVNILV